MYPKVILKGIFCVLPDNFLRFAWQATSHKSSFKIEKLKYISKAVRFSRTLFSFQIAFLPNRTALINKKREPKNRYKICFLALIRCSAPLIRDAVIQLYFPYRCGKSVFFLIHKSDSLFFSALKLSPISVP